MPDVGQQLFELFGRGDDHELGRGRTHRCIQVADDVDLHPRVLGVPTGFRPVALDDQAVVAVGLHVQIALTRVTDDLHRDRVGYAVVEEHAAVECSDLGALIAHDRPLETEPPDPRHRAGERPARASHDGDAPGNDPTKRFDIARIEMELHVEDRAVQVKCEEPVTRGERYFLTSGLTRFGGRPPRTAVAMLRAAIADISERVRTVALAICGASTTLGIGIRPGCTAGSRS